VSRRLAGIDCQTPSLPVEREIVGAVERGF